MNKDIKYKLFKEWIDDKKIIYFEYNYYITPIDKVIRFMDLHEDSLDYDGIVLNSAEYTKEWFNN